jgi:transcriptional/translational regulatory protein YebC/TACO1
MEVAIDAGAEDIKDEGDSFDVLTAPEDFDAVKDAIDGAQIAYEVAEISMVPQNTTAVSGKEAEQMIKFMEALDDCDDIQNFYTNADIPDEAFDAM